MSLVNTLKNLKTNLFGGPSNTGFTQPGPSKVQGIGMTGTPTSSLDSDPLSFGTYQFPKDVFENDQLGHYMVFYVNEQKRSKYDYGTPNAIGVDKFDNPIFANNVGTVTYSVGQINLTGFLPEAIGTIITGNTEPMTVSVIPASSDIKPVREQILLMEDNDITVTMLDDSPSGTYISGVHSTVDGSTLRTGYETK